MAQIDKATGLPYVVKHQGPEARNHAVDFKKLLSTTGTIITVNSTTILAQNLVSEVTPLTLASVQPNGTQVRFIALGGTPNEDYEIQLDVTDSAGNVLVDSILIKVRYANNARTA